MFSKILTRGALALALLAGLGVAHAADAGADKAAATQAQWSVWGGDLAVTWNRELIGVMGLRIAESAKVRENAFGQRDLFELREAGGLSFDVSAGNFDGFTSGSLRARGGYLLESEALRIDLRELELRPRAGDAFKLDLVSADGKAWFYVDRLMYKLGDDRRTLVIRAMDLRATPDLARKLGKPDFADYVVANLELLTNVNRIGDGNAPLGCASTKWPGMIAPMGTYQADVFMESFNAQFMRCNGCDGPGGAGTAPVVYAPSSTLRNNVNSGSLVATVPGDPLGTSTALHAADVAWWTKFSGINEPYGNDQHPYLIWNLYRINSDGQLEQVGASGVKHAFLTINSGCIENPNCGHILGRGCGDTYGTGNNDSTFDLGPRSEIIPATGQWGRCGSIYDPNCDGNIDFNDFGVYGNRLNVTESDIDSSANAGAQYLFESWYIVREDINIYNTMQTRPVTFSWNGSAWAIGNGTPLRLGPAIDRWFSMPGLPTAAAEQVSEIATAEGHAKVAVRVIDLGGGQWRYDFAVSNFDFARANTEGAEPDLRVNSNRGFGSFRIPVDAGVALANIEFADADADAGNDWVSSRDASGLTWSAPAGNTLDWGTLYRFSVVADAAPVSASALLEIDSEGSGETLGADTYAPTVFDDTIFVDDFEL
jgi:hypothetical protein